MKKLAIEDYLHSIDIALNEKPKREIYMIYIMIFGTIFAFSYLLFWDTSFESFQKKQKAIQDTKMKIADDKRYLKLHPKAELVKVDKLIKQTQNEYIKYQDYNQYIKTKIETISFLLYDEGVWGEFLNSIDDKAKQNGIQILELTNQTNPAQSSFGHVMEVSIETKGNYKNLLKFINALEESDLVVDVHTINTSAENFLHSKIDLSVWGIKF